MTVVGAVAWVRDCAWVPPEAKEGEIAWDIQAQGALWPC